MASLRKAFVIALGIAAGVVIAIAGLIAVWSAWEGRARTRDSEAVTGKFLGMTLHFHEEQPTLLTPEYAFSNHTAKELRLSKYSMKVFLRMKDGAMRTVEPSEHFPSEFFLPTKDSVAYKLPVPLNRSIDYSCQPSADTDTKKSVPEKFLKKCLAEIAGITLFIDTPEFLRVDLDLPGKTKDPTPLDGDSTTQSPSTR